MSRKDNRRMYTYQEVDALVKAYQAGDNNAAVRLIDAFTSYLKNYIQLLKNGYIDCYNKNMRKFLCLFVKEYEDRQRIMRLSGKKSGKAIQVLYHHAANVARKFAMVDEEDLWSELVSELLTMAKRYRNDRGCFFHTYVSKAFHYRAYKRVIRLINDPSALAMRNDISIDNEENSDLYIQPDAVDQVINEVDRLITTEDEMDKELGENWIMGFTCSDTFCDLTPLERRVLVLYYNDGYKDSEISEMLGLSRSKISRLRSSARKKLWARKVADACTKRSGSTSRTV